MSRLEIGVASGSSTQTSEYLTYTKKLIQFNLTIEDGYTFSRFNPIIDSGYNITIDDGGEFVVL